MIDWDELVRHEGPAVWRTAYRIVRNGADADECFQEALLAALRVSDRQPVRD
jgi:DNA-directed RNA polymerase specialized sigma24 family protein